MEHGLTTRQQLIEAAERLFAERGIDAVSTSELLLAAGQRNKDAVRYHFGDREGLVLAIAEHRSTALNARRAELLALAVEREPSDARALCGALVLPLAELLDEERNHFLGFLARYHLDRSRRRLVSAVDPRVTTSYRDAARLLRPVSGLSDADFDIRFALVLDMIFTALAGHRAQEEAGDLAAVSRRGRVVDNLIGCAVAALTTPEGTAGSKPAGRSSRGTTDPDRRVTHAAPTSSRWSRGR